MSKIFYDTNCLIKLATKLEPGFCCSSVSLEELENIKTSRNKDDHTKYLARKAVHWLNDHIGEYEVVIYNQDIANLIAGKLLDSTPDIKIVASARYLQEMSSSEEKFIFYTDDICCNIIAKNVFGLDVVNARDEKENIYTGYKEIIGNTEYINTILSSLDDWNVNEYAIICNTDDNSEKEMRFDGDKFVALKLPPSKYIKGKNALQRCALDILANNNITIAAIIGGFGCGKTYLCMQMALWCVREKGWQSKILGIREPRGEGAEVGFLPGELQNKTELFFAPLVQQLDGGEFELERLQQQGMIESNIPYYLKGTTYNNTVMLVDEAEDLTEKQLKLVGTRLGEDSKIFLSGDYKQSIINSTTDNALIRMCNSFKGNSKFACIYLGEDVRSDTSRMFANLFE